MANGQITDGKAWDLRWNAPPSAVLVRHLLPDGTIGPVEKVIQVAPCPKLRCNKARTYIYVGGVKI